MADRKLTQMEEAFLDALVDDECKGNVAKAMAKAGYAKTTSHHLLKRLREEILERAETVLASHAVQAALGMTGAMEDALSPDIKEKMAAMRDVMDRAGVIKKDGVRVGEVSGGAIFILPPVKSEEDG